MDKDIEKTNTKIWRRLDNSAKIFPIISNRTFSTVYRISVVLKEKINKSILEEAVNLSLNKYEAFKVKQKSGFFWYYLEENKKKVVITEESDYPCGYIDKILNNRYLFKITYFESKINLDVFHSLTDGNTALEFLKDITYNYINISHKLQIDDNKLSDEHKGNKANDIEDSYLKNYDSEKFVKRKQKKAFLIKGSKLPFNAIGVTHQFINLGQLKNVCKMNECTITEYLTAKLIYVINNTKYKRDSNKPIEICVPVNLKNFFKSDTLLNFFACITIDADIEQNKLENFNDILNVVRAQFRKKLTEDEIKKTLASDVKLGNNFLIRIIPLILKRVTIQASYSEIRKYVTTTLSNLGFIKVEPMYEEYIEKFLFLLAPEKSEKIKCAICSYRDELVFSFSSVLDKDIVEQAFLKSLKQDNLDIKVEGNGVYDALS